MSRCLVWLIGFLAAAQDKPQERVFAGPDVTVQIVRVAGGSDVLLGDIHVDQATHAIVHAFYYRNDPKLGRLLLSETVTCPAFNHIRTGCDALLDLDPQAVVFVRVLLLREVLSVDVKPNAAEGRK